MNVCPKCGRNQISGPHYSRMIDRLAYICLTCGYRMTTATRDAKHGDGSGDAIAAAFERQRRSVDRR